MDVTATLKTFITDCQATAVNANKLTIPSKGSQMKTLSDAPEPLWRPDDLQWGSNYLCGSDEETQ